MDTTVVIQAKMGRPASPVRRCSSLDGNRAILQQIGRGVHLEGIEWEVVEVATSKSPIDVLQGFTAQDVGQLGTS
jgi:hypothetical protein